MAQLRKRKQGEEEGKGVFGTLLHWVSSWYVLLIFCIFPFYVHNKLFDVLETRFGFFWKSTLLFSGAAFLLWLLQLRQERRRLSFPRWSRVDLGFFLMLLVYAVSTALSPYPYESFWGNQGRYMGLLMQSCIFLCYLMISRCYRFRFWHLTAGILGALLVSLLGICNFYGRDLLEFFVGVEWDKQLIFTSTIGNINTYTSYTALFMGLTGALFCFRKDRREQIFCAVSFVVFTMASIFGQSDNAVLSAAALFFLLPYFCFPQKDRFFRYWFLALLFFLTLPGTAFMIKNGDPAVVRINLLDLPALVHLGLSPLPCLGIALSLLCCGLGRKAFRAEDRRKEEEKPLSESEREERTGKFLLRLWSVFLLLILLFSFYLLYDANVGHHIGFLENFREILVLGPAWGQGRGMNWIFVMQYFWGDMPLLERIIGHGPDTYYIITMDHIYEQMKAAGYGMFDSAHNEYLNLLMTVGVAGVLTYLFQFASSLSALVRGSSAWLTGRRRGAGGSSAALEKKEKQDMFPEERERKRYPVDSSVRHAIFLSVAVYLCQAVVNIAVPIVVPVMYVLLAMGLSKD